MGESGITRMAVLGAGVMGSEIAWVGAAAGLRVVLLDSDPAALERGAGHVAGIAARRVAKGRMDAAAADAVVARVATATDDAALADCGIAVEAVPEVMAIKREVMARLDAALPPGALIGSNTSGLSITEIAAATGRPDRVLGLHFFNPASVMALIEVVRGETTSDATAAAGMALARDLGKVPVAVRECPGFLVNRILVRAMAEAYRSAGASAAGRASVDRAVVDGGPAPMGPFALGDLIGLDTMAHIRRDLEAAYGDRFADGGAVDAQVAAGRLGAKSGAGFYDGSPEGGEATLAGAAAAEAYYAGALDEARRCVDEGVATAPDVEVAMRNGCGWSAGPPGLAP
ncbi:MAG: 3-hydroxyacyl-CoA dehydrogenase NAD-binding domain-containing protein [Thermoleophilia bacterium]